MNVFTVSVETSVQETLGWLAETCSKIQSHKISNTINLLTPRNLFGSPILASDRWFYSSEREPRSMRLLIYMQSRVPRDCIAIIEGIRGAPLSWIKSSTNPLQVLFRSTWTTSAFETREDDTLESLWRSYFGERQMILFPWRGAPINTLVNLHHISSPSRLHIGYRRHSRGSPQLNKILDRSPRFGQGIIERRVVVAFWNLKPVKAFRSLSVVQILLRSTWATSAFETRDDAQELLWRSYFGERQMILFLWRGAPTNALVNPYLISSPSRLHIDYRRHSRGSPQLNKILDRSPRFSQGSSRGASSSRSSVRDPCHPFGRCPLSRFFYACLERILRRELTKNLLWWVPPKCRDLAWSFLIVGILRGRVAWLRPAPSRWVDLRLSEDVIGTGTVGGCERGSSQISK